VEPRKRAISVLAVAVPLLAAMLFSVHPLLALFAHNQSEIEITFLWWPLAICVAVAAALFGVFLLIFKNPRKAGGLASLVVIAFFYYGIYLDKAAGWGLSKGLFVVFWLLLFLLAALWLVRTKSDLVNVKIARYQSGHPPIDVSDSRLWSSELAAPSPPAGKRPDIYVIIPDDYARSDVLKRYFHYDNTAFRRALTSRGFVISDDVRSPYSDSEMNIASEVNLDYVNGLGRILGADSQDARPPRRLIHDSRASRILSEIGYRYIHMDTDLVTFPAGNPHISSIDSPDSFTTLWLQGTVLGEVGGPLGFTDGAVNARFRKTIRKGFSQLAEVPSEPSPKFVLFHTIIPHDPYIFGPRGEAVTFKDPSGEAHTRRIGMTYYLKQLRYVETLLLEAVDAIKARSNEPPVIVILSDEGFEGNEEVLGEETMRDIRVKGIAAFHLPGKPNATPPRKLNAVNAMRFVFNQTLGTRYPLLENASYPELDAPYQFEEMPVRGVAK
jgi:hypothetical protein